MRLMTSAIHQLVRDERKISLRRRFFRDYLEHCEVHLVNTVRPPEETQAIIRGIVSRCEQ